MTKRKNIPGRGRGQSFMARGMNNPMMMMMQLMRGLSRGGRGRGGRGGPFTRGRGRGGAPA